MKRVAHVLWRSRGGMRRHVRTLAAHPPAGWETSSISGPAEVRAYFDGLPFEPVSRLGLLMAGRNADVVHAHGVNAGTTALLPGGPPVVLSLHVVVGASGLTSRSRGAAELARLVAARADALIAVSRASATGFPDARMIPPAFDPLAAPSLSRERVREMLGARADDVVAIAVSRLDEGKRLELFVRAVQGAGCAGWIVGDGPERRRLEKATADTSVKMLGYRSDVSDLLHAADMFALPSASESYGIAVAEAVAAGLPVVATRTGAVEELAGAAGLVVDVDDEQGFVQAVRRLAIDASERTRLASAAKQVRMPDRDALIARVGAVYDELTR